MQSISFIKQIVSEEKIFKDFFENLPFLGPQQPIKISDQDEGHLKHSELFNKHFVGPAQKCCNSVLVNFSGGAKNFLISLKSLVIIHNQDI